MNTMQYSWSSQTDTAALLARLPRATLEQPSNDRRRFGRLRSEGTLHCNLGRVLDLSRGGVRVLCGRRLKGNRLAQLSIDDRGLELQAKVIWCERVGFGQHVAGLEFPDTTPELAHQLTAFANS